MEENRKKRVPKKKSEGYKEKMFQVKTRCTNREYQILTHIKQSVLATGTSQSQMLMEAFQLLRKKYKIKELKQSNMFE